MITRITRDLLLIQHGISFSLEMLSLRFVRIVHPIAAALFGICVVIVIRALITANNFFPSYRFRSDTPPGLRRGWRKAFQLFLEEFTASMLSCSWTMAFLRFDIHIVESPAGLPVLLVHGYGCNIGYWHCMSRALTKANISHYALDLEPVFADIE